MAKRKGKKKTTKRRSSRSKSRGRVISWGEIGIAVGVAAVSWTGSALGVNMIRNMGRREGESVEAATKRAGLSPIMAPILVSGAGGMLALMGGQPVAGIATIAGAVPVGIGVVASQLEDKKTAQGDVKQPLIKRLAHNVIGLAGDEGNVYSVPLDLSGGSMNPLGSTSMQPLGNDGNTYLMPDTMNGEPVYMLPS